MQSLTGTKLESLPIPDLEKVGDIIEFEGPILSHFKDKYGSDYLFYWVDYNEFYNRWLVWKITKEQLYVYLTKKLTLREILLDQNKDNVFTVDYDENLTIGDVYYIGVQELIEKYIPEEGSFYQEILPDYYSKFVNNFENGFYIEPEFYIETMRQKAIYLTLFPKVKKFASSISTVEASEFLKKVTASYLNFIEYDFLEQFKMGFVDISKVNKAVRDLKHLLTPRIVDLKYSSFKVGISVDTVNRIDNGEKYASWQKTVLNKYKAEVIDIDFNSEEEAKAVIDKYPLEIREKIFGPIIDVFSHEDYSVEVSNLKGTEKQVKKAVDEAVAERIAPNKRSKKPDEVAGGKKLMSLIVEVDEKVGIKGLGKKNIESGTLFAQEIDGFTSNISKIVFNGYTFEFKEPLQSDINLKNGVYYLTNADMSIEVFDPIKEKLFEKFYIQFTNLYVTIFVTNTFKNDNIKARMENILLNVTTPD